jgi:DNA topoisomerase II
MPKNIEERYIKLTHKEHILTRPETYIGSINRETKSIFVADNYEEDIKNTNIIYKEVEYNPGFIKIFDEIITNASDHAIRTGSVTYIKINIEGDTISVENDGQGIPVVIHEKEKIYVPELIFGHLLTGENYDDSNERFVGGRNGYGAKLTNIYSKLFQVETADGKKTYRQKFTNNMSNMTKPHTRKSKQQFTRITYKPDFEKFSMESIDEVTKSILVKRIFDIAAYNPKLRVHYNGRIVPIRTFRDYIKLFVNDDSNIFYEKINDNWEVAISESPVDTFTHVSMVNGISTVLGGTHVNHTSNYVINTVKTLLTRGVKGVNIRPNDVKNRIMLFVNCKLPNPTFDNQTKENLTLRLNGFIKDFKMNDSLMRRLSKSDMFADLVELSKMKELLESQKELNKQVNKRIRIEKLVDANNAGKMPKSNNCHLFLTEGDSAKSLAIAGFSIIGRDNYGAFPLKGKPLNVRDTLLKKIKDNDEIKNLIQILGLEFGKKYKNTNDLRYGKVVIMSDSDTDGYHIKGLIINLFDTFWPELLKMDFLYEFVTPIIIASQGKRKKMFYKINEYNKWIEETKTSDSYKTKYYKGLGTLGPQLGKELFKDLDKHLIPFKYTNPEKTRDLIDLAFNKKRQDDRKEWLSNYKLNSKFDKFAQKTTYESFMDNEFIEFSMEDNVRSIPSVVDGLKPSQRKIMYTLLKLNKGEMNVGEVFGHVKALAEYHHGPASLEQGIINMAQDYVGSNNISLLLPNGSFGTRLSGGKDSAAARYIYTEIRNMTKSIFLKDDDDILDYLEVDGKDVEPKYYLPIIPQVLLNGTEGIGTGWSSVIPKFKLEDLIQYVDNKINNKRKNIILNPYFEGFKGEVYYDEERDNCVTKGVLEKVNDSTIVISELPIGVWNETYYVFLDKLLDDKVIKSYQKNCTDDTVDIRIKMFKEILSPLTDDELYSLFDLESRINMSNMHLFNSNGKIKKYDTQYDIIDDYYDIRLDNYEKRRQFIINKLETKKIWFVNTIKFIKLFIKGDIKISNVPIETIKKSLIKNNIVEIDGGYNYIFNLSIYKLTREELERLKENFKKLKEELEGFNLITPEKMWHKDLLSLKSELKKHRNDN